MNYQESKNRENKANELISETSPYLLQHAYNPVRWHGWNKKTLEKARTENKMLLISIGYSACHWCHVMEKESFENEKIAELMNQNFICIKVDREERPDVDSLYMQAVQLIHGNGGWPLNCFALPDGRPFYGGTYFQPIAWEQLLVNIAKLNQTQRDALQEQAEKIMEGLGDELFGPDFLPNSELDASIAVKAHEKLSKSFDHDNGGFRGAPKFPMPNNLLFLLYFSNLRDKPETREFVRFTLNKMASGGIYDHLGGGFSRYSVDAEWRVPHFEKMLYDNAQLISLYSIFSQLTGKEIYLQTATKTADFVLAELTSPEGYFYSALDADSEGEEGKFYVWTKRQFEEILNEEAELVGEYFGVGKEALWEEGKNILLKTSEPEDFAAQKGLSLTDLENKLSQANFELLNHRNTRVRPGLDDKSLTSWNSMMISALAQLTISSGNKKYYWAATLAANHLLEKVMDKNGLLYHNFKGKSSIPGFLEDYAFLAEALINLYETDFDEKWLVKALEICESAVTRFYDEKDGFFWFTDHENHELVARKKEMMDNVIPSSNSTMAKVLFILGRVFERSDYIEMSTKMLQGVSDSLANYPSAFSNWGIQLLFQTGNFYEVVVTGKESKQKANEIFRMRYPAKFVLAAEEQSGLPLFSNRFIKGKTLIYVCSGNRCQLPVEAIPEALKLMVT